VDQDRLHRDIRSFGWMKRPDHVNACRSLSRRERRLRGAPA
jgi:hypothetical protein